MFKQIFDKTNGTPKLIQSTLDEETGAERFVYDEDRYTEEMPSSELYEPIFYKDGKWQGISYNEWEYNRSVEESGEEKNETPSTNDLLNAQLLSNDLEQNSKIEDLQQDIANLTAELLKLQGGADDVRDS
ncbi:hypothetical protein ACVDHH_01425 [Staphylococcus saprophyticus]